METAIERDFFRENVELAASSDPSHAELLKALRSGLRTAELRTAIRDVDRALLGGRLRHALMGRPAVSSVGSAPDDG
jgi:hypothetical protein